MRDLRRTLALAAGLSVTLQGSPGAGAARFDAGGQPAQSLATPIPEGLPVATGTRGTPSFQEPVSGPRDSEVAEPGILDRILDALHGAFSLGPSIVVGEAACPRSADGHAIDCGGAAKIVCARNGFGSGLELGTVTRRICRGTVAAHFAGSGGAYCNDKTFVARAVCW